MSHLSSPCPWFRRLALAPALFLGACHGSAPPPAPGKIPPVPEPDPCESLAGPSACVGASIARRLCESFGPKVLAPVAASYVACAREGDPCESGRAVRCGLRAVDTAHGDAAHHDECVAIAADCTDVAPEITAARCESMFGAFQPASRPALAECLHAACGSGSFGVCLP